MTKQRSDRPVLGKRRSGITSVNKRRIGSAAIEKFRSTEMTSTTASHDQVDPEASNEGPKRLASLRLRAITLTKELVWFTRDIDQIVEDQQDLRHKVSRLHIDLVDCIQATEAFSFSSQKSASPTLKSAKQSVTVEESATAEDIETLSESEAAGDTQAVEDSETAEEDDTYETSQSHGRCVSPEL